MQKEINHEWIYEQSPSEIWEYLTKEELITLWLMPNNFKPILGHKFQFMAKPIPSLDLDGIFHCEILEIVPFQKLVYTWKGGPSEDITTLDTIVAWTLEKNENGTKLLLRQSGYKEINHSIFIAMTDGWQKQVQKMIDHINAKL